MERIQEWDDTRLVNYRTHLERLLVYMAGQNDPRESQLRAEHESVCAEIESRKGRTYYERG